MEELDNPLNDLPKIKSLESGNSAMALAYLAFPPQMKFVPTDKELEKLIWTATKFRYMKDIPKIL